MVPPEFAEESADARRQRERYNLMGTYSAAPARAAMIAMSTQQSAAAHVELSTAAGMIRVKVPGNILDDPKAEEPMAQPARRGLVAELGHTFACILSGRLPDPPGERPRRPSGESLSSGRRRRPSGEAPSSGRRRRPSSEASSGSGSGSLMLRWRRPSSESAAKVARTGPSVLEALMQPEERRSYERPASQDSAEAAKARATMHAKLLEDRVLKELEIAQMWHRTQSVSWFPDSYRVALSLD